MSIRRDGRGRSEPARAAFHHSDHYQAVSTSPVLSTSPHVPALWPHPASDAMTASASSSSLHRQTSRSSHRSGLIPSPRLSGAMLPPSFPSSSSGSKNGSLIPTPKVLSRRNSTKDSHRSSGILGRRRSQKAKIEDRENMDRVPSGDGWKSPLSESGSADVIETPQLRLDRDPGTGRKMINQYLVLQEIGHGTHGRVRLGRDMSVEAPTGEDEDIGLGIAGNVYYAIKIVDRNPKRKRLTGFNRQKIGKNEGGKLVNESEIRKEIAIFKKVHHPNVVRMKEIIDDPESSKIFMILEYCEGGEIQWKNQDSSPALTLAEIRRIFRDTLLGLEYLHHQGIIHRDIKPSNLLVASDGTVKISDFGCSHYSEALQVASSHMGPEGEGYVDDVELAKTAGSPAFFAPEMCYSGIDTGSEAKLSVPSKQTPSLDLPAFILRPPSVVDSQGETKPLQSDPQVLSPPESSPLSLKPTLSKNSTHSRHCSTLETQSVPISPVHPVERLPMTNAIDVWALGVTLYCLLFGRTPFDAANEYLLMQVIPVADYEIPEYMGQDRLPTRVRPDSPRKQEISDCLNLLRRLLEKDPSHRITLEQVKNHPFILWDLADPSGWLASTDPHAQSFVTVSNDEVAAVVIKSSSFRDKFRKGIKSISNKLQIFGTVGRSRSRSIGDTDGASASQHTSNTPSAVPSEVNLSQSPQAALPRSAIRRLSGSQESSPVTSPGPPTTLSRRFSLLATNNSEAVLPSRRQTIQTVSPRARVLSPSPVSVPPIPGLPAAKRGFIVHRNTGEKGMTLKGSIPVTATLNQTSQSSRHLTSSSSLDKLKASSSSSPTGSLQRRQSSDIDVLGRQRSPSTSSSTGMNFGSKLVRLLSRNNSQRSRLLKQDNAIRTSSDVDDVEASGDASSHGPPGRISLDEGPTRQSLETLESSSYSSGRGNFPSPDIMQRGAWESRLMRARQPLRRGSNLSEEYTPDSYEDEVDWNEPLSDDEDYDVDPNRPSLPPSAPNLRSRWGLEATEPLRSSMPPQSDPSSRQPGSSSDARSSGNAMSPLFAPNTINRSPNLPILPAGSRISSRASSRGSHSPFHSTFAFDRARNPLGHGGPQDVANQETSQERSPGPGLDDLDGDDGLAISVGSRRGRKGSILDRRALPIG